MSQRNVELFSRAVAAFNLRDLDAYLALIDAEVEFTPHNVWAEGGGPYRGHDGVRTWWTEIFDVLPDLTAEVYEVRDLGETMFVHGRLHGQGLASGAQFERTMWMAIEWRDGKQVWWCDMGTEAEALEAAELRA